MFDGWIGLDDQIEEIQKAKDQDTDRDVVTLADVPCNEVDEDLWDHVWADLPEFLWDQKRRSDTQPTAATPKKVTHVVFEQSV